MNGLLTQVWAGWRETTRDSAEARGWQRPWAMTILGLKGFVERARSRLWPSVQGGHQFAVTLQGRHQRDKSSTSFPSLNCAGLRGGRCVHCDGACIRGANRRPLTQGLSLPVRQCDRAASWGQAAQSRPGLFHWEAGARLTSLCLSFPMPPWPQPLLYLPEHFMISRVLVLCWGHSGAEASKAPALEGLLVEWRDLHSTTHTSGGGGGPRCCGSFGVTASPPQGVPISSFLHQVSGVRAPGPPVLPIDFSFPGSLLHALPVSTCSLSCFQEKPGGSCLQRGRGRIVRHEAGREGGLRKASYGVPVTASDTPAPILDHNPPHPVTSVLSRFNSDGISREGAELGARQSWGLQPGVSQTSGGLGLLLCQWCDLGVAMRIQS